MGWQDEPGLQRREMATLRDNAFAKNRVTLRDHWLAQMSPNADGAPITAGDGPEPVPEAILRTAPPDALREMRGLLDDLWSVGQRFAAFAASSPRGAVTDLDLGVVFHADDAVLHLEAAWCPRVSLATGDRHGQGMRLPSSPMEGLCSSGVDG